MLELLTVLAALLAVAQGASMLIASGPSRPARAVSPTDRSAGQPAPTTLPGQPAPTPLPRSVPVRVSIPAIDADSSLIPLGLTADQTLETPPVEDPMQAGWYSLSPTPGEAGAAVIVGHVDGHHDPGIFYQLYKLKRGDQIRITRQDGTTARFSVYRTTQVDKSDFPTDQVYAATTRPELRLITCGGIFNRASGNYTDNIIIFAALAASP
ncbi:class F sortase [Planosporangium flavigriseum]|uniref:Class F sortase n=1 Tax=Planosporangium flavigriseum TaxID=373681 RepID=A0A8J3LZT9_9ACTN|nr:class F sortase [Planosporangium flavigriseum]